MSTCKWRETCSKSYQHVSSLCPRSRLVLLGCGHGEGGRLLVCFEAGPPVFLCKAIKNHVRGSLGTSASKRGKKLLFLSPHPWDLTLIHIQNNFPTRSLLLVMSDPYLTEVITAVTQRLRYRSPRTGARSVFAGDVCGRSSCIWTLFQRIIQFALPQRQCSVWEKVGGGWSTLLMAPEHVCN